VNSIRVVLALAVLAPVACGDDDAEDDSSADTTADDSADSGSSTTDEPVPEAGPLGCPADESCTIVVASQALDDRVEFFTARGSGPAYRGAIDLDLKPNPAGNNEGENLDEPFGLSVDATGLAILIGHYPARDNGSLVVFPHDMLAMYEAGTTIAQGEFFAGGAFTSAVGAVELGEEEPIFMLRHPSGRLLVAAFENDLFAPETEWTAPGKLLVIDPADPGSVGARTLDDVGGASCLGAWSIVALDDAMDRIAISCDGDEGAAVLDVSMIGEGSVVDAAAAVGGCIADVPSQDKRVRSIAPDGSGGFLLVEHNTIADGMPGRLWRYDGECTLLGMGSFPGTLFETRETVLLASDDGPRWLMSTGRTADRGVHVVRDGATGPEICAKLTEIDALLVDDDGGELHPYALGLDRAHTGLAVGAGPRDAVDDQPAAGRVLWAELDAGVDPCASTPVVEVTDLTASGPAVAADDPATWRRGPNVVYVQEYGP